MKVFTNQWCVYGHYVGGKCIYIGMGRPHRAFDCRKRSADWFALVAAGHDVEILSWHPTKEECLSQEIQAIQQVKPPCNKMHNGWVHEALKKNWNANSRPQMTSEVKARIAATQRASWQSGKRRPCTVRRHGISIVRQDTGEVYDTMTIAARHLGVSVTAVSFAVANKGRKIRGVTLVREVPPHV